MPSNFTWRRSTVLTASVVNLLLCSALIFILAVSSCFPFADPPENGFADEFLAIPIAINGFLTDLFNILLIILTSIELVAHLLGLGATIWNGLWATRIYLTCLIIGLLAAAIPTYFHPFFSFYTVRYIVSCILVILYLVEFNQNKNRFSRSGGYASMEK